MKIFAILCYINNKPLVNKDFPSVEYGSREKALIAAVKYRDEQREILIKSGKLRRDRNRKRPQKNNTSGVLGVSRTRAWSGRLRIKLDHYDAQTAWIDPESGETKTASFSEKKYGRKKAEFMAKQCYKLKENIFK